MKFPFTRTASFTLGFAFAALSRGVAQDAASDQQSAAYRASVAQDALNHDASGVQQQLASLREEMQQIMPEDAALLDKAFQQLESLSKNQMDQATGALLQASKSSDLKTQLDQLAGALQQQTAISLSLKRLAGDLNARQSLAAIEPKLEELLKRQVAAGNEVGRLASVNTDPSRLHDAAQRRYDIVCGDQDAITADIGLAGKSIDDLVQTLPENARDALVKAGGIAKSENLVANAANAAKLAHVGPLDQAGQAQAAVSHALADMIQALAAGSSLADRLKNLAEEIEKIEEAQKDTMNADSQRSNGRHDAEEREADLSDQVAATQAELQPLDSRAADDLQTARQGMENAVAALQGDRRDRAAAAPAQQAALAALEAAKQDLQKQIAQAAAESALTPQQVAAGIGALERETAEAAIEQNRDAAQSPAAANPSLQSKTDDLQQAAAPLSPQAAQLLGDAAQQMQQPDAASQAAAAQSLAQAAQALAQQEAALTGQTPAQQALAQAGQQVAQAAATTQQAQNNLASDQTSANAVDQLQAAGQQLAAAMRMAAAANAPAAAQAALAQAGQSVAQAQMNAAGIRLPQAQAAAQAAQGAMAMARQGMADASRAIAQQAVPGSPQQAPDARGGGQTASQQGIIRGEGAGTGAPVQVVTGLSPHDRDAITQLQNEKPPQEYAPEVQQYYKNLGDGAGL